MENWNLGIDQFVKFLMVMKTALCAAPWPVFEGRLDLCDRRVEID